MKKITLIIIALLMVSLTACNNPLSSEYEDQGTNNGHTPLYSGYSENG